MRKFAAVNNLFQLTDPPQVYPTDRATVPTLSRLPALLLSFFIQVFSFDRLLTRGTVVLLHFQSTSPTTIIKSPQEKPIADVDYISMSYTRNDLCFISDVSVTIPNLIDTVLQGNSYSNIQFSKLGKPESLESCKHAGHCSVPSNGTYSLKPEEKEGTSFSPLSMLSVVETLVKFKRFAVIWPGSYPTLLNKGIEATFR